MEISKKILQKDENLFEITYNKNKKFNIITKGEFSPEDLRKIAVSLLSLDTQNFINKVQNLFTRNLNSSTQVFKSYENLTNQFDLLYRINYYQKITPKIIEKLNDFYEKLEAELENVKTKVKSYGESINFKINIDDNIYILTINIKSETHKDIMFLNRTKNEIILDEIVSDNESFNITINEILDTLNKEAS